MLLKKLKAIKKSDKMNQKKWDDLFKTTAHT